MSGIRLIRTKKTNTIRAIKLRSFKQTILFHKRLNINCLKLYLLRSCMTKQGKILPRRVNKIKSKYQNKIKRAIKQSRVLGYLPYTPSNLFSKTKEKDSAENEEKQSNNNHQQKGAYISRKKREIKNFSNRKSS
uniref:Ribosomal protein S18 n=1 Tax=Astrosyne radiata TaxID=1158023 RepID=A0A2U9NT89_9STRA|nr:ribosomal protein S18 [Astrosyne radiata]AWT40308.1 ribosomal protein S18 [Astrosyne radiata]